MQSIIVHKHTGMQHTRRKTDSAFPPGKLKFILCSVSRGSYKTWTGVWTGMESGIFAHAH